MTRGVLQLYSLDGDPLDLKFSDVCLERWKAQMRFEEPYRAGTIVEV
jgi:hypothetical protein